MSKGFTLVEILVVVSIITILSGITFVSYSTILKNSRDYKRQSDLGILQSSLEQYHADQFAYPSVGSTCTNGAVSINCPLKDPNGQKTYQSMINGDQLASPYPQYSYKQVNTSYCIYAALENGPKNADGSLRFQGSSSCSASNPLPCTSDSAAGSCYNFAVSPP